LREARSGPTSEGATPEETMPRTRFVTTATAALFLMVGPAFAQPNTPTPTPPPTPTPSTANQPSPTAAEPAPTTGDEQPADVLAKLHHSNQAEIEAGKLAQEKGQSKGVKEYGKMLVKDHTAADKQVASVAKQLKVELPTGAPEMKHDKLEQARALSGPEFDKAFTEAMIEDHKNDIEEVTEARDKATDPKLKKLLSEMVPKLEKHRDKAEKLNAAANAEGSHPK
jgi:putative membrane protein